LYDDEERKVGGKKVELVLNKLQQQQPRRNLVENKIKVLTFCI
jgi:hypothetical protein